VRRFRPLVLCYHAITDDWPHALATGPAMLERQLRAFLARGYRPGSVAQAIEGRARILHVTFDDAFTSIERALPILERLGLGATVFACSGYADGGRPLDVPELADDAARFPGELATMDWDVLRSLDERGIGVESHTVSHPHLPRLGDEELRRELSESRLRLEAELGRPVRLLA
jgi:peptidoglycan/xylan/chitin deacetylase (PgdA/CDA1 family)